MTKESCKTCIYCKYIRTPSITGNPIDFVCQRKSAVIDDIEIKCCDGMYKLKRNKRCE